MSPAVVFSAVPRTGWPAIAGMILVLLAPVVRAAEPPAALLQAEQQRVAVIEAASRSAVSIFMPDGNGGGSGVLISADGYALSNFHVTSPIGDYLKCGLNDGRMYDAVVVSIDPTGDVALIKLLGRTDFVPAPLGDSDEVRVGDWCFVVGNPFLLATDLQPSVSFGIVSGVHRYQYPAGSILEYADCLQTDAAINPGNSGGAMFNARGELVGIVGRGSFEKRGRVNVGVGYAISMNQIRNFLGHLHGGLLVDHATLGATVDRDEQGRIVVSNILENSDAYRRGLRYGDEILSIGGRQVTSVNALKNVLGIFPAGWRIPVSYRHDGQRFDVHVRLMGVHTRAELVELINAKVEPEEKPRERPQDQPPPGGPGQPEAPKKGGSRDGLPELPPVPQPAARSAPPKVQVPAEAARLIVPRSGFKNFYFNELHRQRVWSQLASRGDFSTRSKPWQIKGRSTDGGEITMVLGDDSSTLQLPGGIQVEVTESRDWSEQLEPGGTGLLAAFHLWRRLLVLGPGKFGDVRYGGTAPVPGQPGLWDVLIATRNVSESLLYCDPKTGVPVAWEMFPDPGADPCELVFADYRPVAGRSVPHHVIARRGGEVIADWKFLEVSQP